MKILLAVDGSPVGIRAARFAVTLVRQLAQPAELVLFHADRPLLRDAAARLGRATVQRYQADNVEFAIKGARSALTKARVPFTVSWVAGNPAAEIVRHASKGRFDLVIMGSHGRGALKGLLLGSVATKVIALGSKPVLLVR